MNYPTLEQVNEADAVSVCRWFRYLPSPGTSAIGTPEMEKVRQAEAIIMDRLVERFHKESPMTPTISKLIDREREPFV